jgi:hypothetical protein
MVCEILCYMAVHNTPVIINGTRYYVREVGGLVNLNPDPSSLCASYYPPELVGMSMDQQQPIVDPPVDHDIVDGIVSLSHGLDMPRLLQVILDLKWNDRVAVLEASVLCHGPLLSMFMHSMVVIGDVLYHVYMYRRPVKGSYKTSSRSIRCGGLTRRYDGSWSYASLAEEMAVVQHYDDKVRDLDASLSGYRLYGIRSTVDGKLRIRDMDKDKDTSDMRRIHRGRDVMTLNRDILGSYITRLRPDVQVIPCSSVSTLAGVLEGTLASLGLLLYV